MHGPIYKLRASDCGKPKDIEIDVTKSASSFSSLGSGVKTILCAVLSNPALDIKDVVEFGAGKLKNAPFILQMGKTLSAVEFERLYSNPITARNYSLCQEHNGSFRRLTPEQFESDGQKYDLALLINVLATMPYRKERESAVELLHSKLRDGKFALVFWLKNDDLYKKRFIEGKTCNDGVWLGDGRRYQTFYANDSPEGIITLMRDAGFTPFSRFHIETNHAILFRK